MLRIENKNKLMGLDFQLGPDVWKVEGIYEYPTAYHFHLRTKNNPDKVFILTKEEDFVEGNNNYKISDSDEPFNSMWVKLANVSTITSMLRTLRKIVSYANN
jgi:hypothetical protein